MALAIFDLDNTLIAGDSDHAWGEYLAENNIVDAATHQQQNDKFYDDYLEGSLDIYEFLKFSLTSDLIISLFGYFFINSIFLFPSY